MTDNRTTELLREAEREIVILRDKLRIANGTGAKTCVKCGTFLSDELLCTECAIAAWNTRAELGSGTLTAEQVMTISGKHQPDYCSDTHVCFDWQAIADELNATLGGGTCEQVLTDCDDGLAPPFTAHCSACGAEWGFSPKYCHNCGAKVTGTRDGRKAVKR